MTDITCQVCRRHQSHCASQSRFWCQYYNILFSVTNRSYTKWILWNDSFRQCILEEQNQHTFSLLTKNPWSSVRTWALWSAENFMQFHEVPLHYFVVGVWSAVGKKRIIGPNKYTVHTLTPYLKNGRFRENVCLLQQKSATANTEEFRSEMNNLFVKCDACWT